MFNVILRKKITLNFIQERKERGELWLNALSFSPVCTIRVWHYLEAFSMIGFSVCSLEVHDD